MSQNIQHKSPAELALEKCDLSHKVLPGVAVRSLNIEVFIQLNEQPVLDALHPYLRSLNAQTSLSKNRLLDRFIAAQKLIEMAKANKWTAIANADIGDVVRALMKAVAKKARLEGEPSFKQRLLTYHQEYPKAKALYESAVAANADMAE